MNCAFNSSPHTFNFKLHLLMPDCRKTPEEVKKLDEEDRYTYRMGSSDGTIAYHFTLGGVSAQNRTLRCLLDGVPHARYQVPLCCPICRAGLGMFIYAKTGNKELSENQQRKNRNTMLFGSSHMKKTHPVLVSKPVSAMEAFEQNVTAMTQVSAKQFRAGPSAASLRATAAGQPQLSPTSAGVKRKPEQDISTDRLLKRPAVPIQVDRCQTMTPKCAGLVITKAKCQQKASVSSSAVVRPKSRKKPAKPRTNDYYVDEDGQVNYDKPEGWHPDDEEESNYGESEED